ncbi:hypothetical protein WR25_19797 [Diploscapter pachys]|uniref:Uncharacterized protein n=1 Tax=Diploscapter pachys TaxID=2018661 RepID=A0A2A2KEC9_9BILA|nr:hypothetical protein WR25_19797 [Diploscapter pachys]
MGGTAGAAAWSARASNAAIASSAPNGSGISAVTFAPLTRANTATPRPIRLAITSTAGSIRQPSHRPIAPINFGSPPPIPSRPRHRR